MNAVLPESPAARIEQPTSKRVNLLDEINMTPNGAERPTLIRFDSNETPVLPFTPEGDRVEVHFVDDPDFRGYLRCNGPDCLLCRIGRSTQTQTLLPVYAPGMRRVDVLALSQNMSPGALKPQLLAVLASERPQVAWVKKIDNMRYAVSTMALAEGADGGRDVIAEFVKKREAGQVDLPQVYPAYTNKMLSELGSIASIMQIKGLQKPA
jgi:hypothetical protein